ncbi:hypothetical protein QFC24_000915 [Naganishia onofrii]|uniref:Uncharacterized protein n=1 Tax=Naganishia onofrii TaxID=1851511 RepID=A0ACC2XV48_9TREE|nr:hypothetical protein QFC24_000915 [Naganishia onofrii]
MAPDQNMYGQEGREKERERATNHAKNRVGQYILGTEIGKGSFATVYKGYIQKTREPVAIKAVSRGKLTPKLLENLEGEIAIMKACIHRNVVALRECMKNEHFIYLVMEFCSGGDLSIYIRKRGRLPSLEYHLADPTGATEGQMMFWPHPKEGGLDDFAVRNFLGQLADALKFLRSKNLIHRDLKPQNLLLQPPTEAEYASGHPLGIPMLKVADFGFARSLPAAALAETLCGSPLYMAPEILRYEKYDAKADLWSVGALLFEMAVGKPPFKALNHIELLKKIERNDDRIRFPDEEPLSRDEMEDYSDIKNAPPVAPDIKELIRKLLKKRPVMRMSFNEFFDCRVWAGCMKQPRKSSHAAYLDQRSPKLESRKSSTSALMLGQRRVSEEQSSRTSSGVSRDTAVAPMTRRTTEPKYYVSPVQGKAGPVEAVRSEQRTKDDSSRHRRSVTDQGGKGKDIPRSSQYERDRSYSNSSQRRTPELRTPNSHDMARNSNALSSDHRRNGESMGKSSEEGDKKLKDSDEYVVVEKRNIEVNSLADELDAAARRPELLSRRRSSRMSALTRPISALAAGASAAANAVANSTGGSPVSYSPPFTMSSTPPFALPPGAHRPRAPSFHSVSSSPNLQTRTRPVLVPHSVTTYGSSLTYHQNAHDAQQRYSESSSPGNQGLTRVLTSAGMRFFGSPASRAQNPEEEALVQKLDELGQMASAMVEFADSKLALCTPNAVRPSPILGHSSISPSSYLQTAAARRRSSTASMASVDRSSARLDFLCAEALVVYVKALAFLQHGVNLARGHWESRVVSYGTPPTGPEFNEIGFDRPAVQWFRTRFNDCFEKAEWARSRCPEDMPESAAYVEQMFFDKAVDLSRVAAKLELEGDDELLTAEHAYVSCLWLLTAYCDDIMRDNQPISDQEKIAAEKVMEHIQVRLDSTRRKIALANSSAVTLTDTSR